MLECNALVFGKPLKQLNKAIIDQASLDLVSFGLFMRILGIFVKSARYALVFAPNCRRGLRVRLRLLVESNLVNAVAIVVDTNRVVGRDADEFAVVPHAWHLALDHGVRGVLCNNKWKLAADIFKLLLGGVVGDQDIVS